MNTWLFNTSAYGILTNGTFEVAPLDFASNLQMVIRSVQNEANAMEEIERERGVPLFAHPLWLLVLSLSFYFSRTLSTHTWFQIFHSSLVNEHVSDARRSLHWSLISYKVKWIFFSLSLSSFLLEIRPPPHGWIKCLWPWRATPKLTNTLS